MEKSNKKVFGFPKTSIGLCGAVLGTALIFVTLSPFRSEGAKQINHPLCGCASKVKPS